MLKLTIYLFVIASSVSANQTSSNTTIAAICEAKCYLYDPVPAEFVEPFVWECKTEECKQCLQSFKPDVFASNKSKEECIGKCENNYCKQSCECRFNSTVLGSRIANNNVISKPSLLCLEIKENQSLSTIYIEWVMQKKELPPAVYVLKMRDKTKNNVISQWKTLGQGVHDVVPVKNVRIDLQYQFFVTAVFPNGSTVVSEESEWIQLTKAKKLMPPKNVKISNMSLSRNHNAIDVVLSLDEPPAKPCYYGVFWYPQTLTGGGSYGKGRIDLTKRFPDIVLANLTYSSNYTVDIISTSKDKHTESDKLRLWLTTLSCLEVHNNSFNICGPYPPRELKILVDEGTAYISWKKPLHASSVNKVIKYSLNVSKTINVTEGANFKALQKEVFLLENETSIAFVDLDPESKYAVSLCAISLGGDSVIVNSNFTTEPKLNHVEINALDGHSGGLWYSIGGGIGTTILVVFVILCCCYKRRQSNKKLEKKQKDCENQFYPNATKDVYITCKKLLPNLDKYEVDISTIKFMEKIGEGAFGVVRKAEYNKRIIAVKMVKDNATEDDQLQLIQEIEILKDVGTHPNVVSLVAYCTRGPKICLAVEYCPLGDLQTYLRKFREQILDGKYSPIPNLDSGLGNSLQETGVNYAELLHEYWPHHPNHSYQNVHSYVNHSANQLNEILEERVTPSQLISYARQIAKGMEYLAHIKLVHRDLAARNILLASQEVVKISDFGLTRDVYERNIYQKMTKGKLPIKWMALESIEHQIYTTKSDVWSFGVVLWEITTLGGMPYPTMTGSHQLVQYLKRDMRMEKPDNCSEKIYQLMISCWNLRPILRPTFTELKQKLEEILEGTRQYMNFDVTGHEEYYKHYKVDGLVPKPIKCDETDDSAFGGSEEYIKSDGQKSSGCFSDSKTTTIID